MTSQEDEGSALTAAFAIMLIFTVPSILLVALQFLGFTWAPVPFTLEFLFSLVWLPTLVLGGAWVYSRRRQTGYVPSG